MGVLHHILQWNIRSLRCHIQDLRRPVGERPLDMLTLQEIHSLAGECRLPGNVELQCTSSYQERRTSLYVRSDIRLPLDALSVSFGALEFVDATVHLRGQTCTLEGGYVPPSFPWNPEVLRMVDRIRTGKAIIRGDFKAHHQSWGSSHTDSPRIALANIAMKLDLQFINAELPPFAGPDLL